MALEKMADRSEEKTPGRVSPLKLRSKLIY